VGPAKGKRGREQTSESVYKELKGVCHHIPGGQAKSVVLARKLSMDVKKLIFLGSDLLGVLQGRGGRIPLFLGRSRGRKESEGKEGERENPDGVCDKDIRRNWATLGEGGGA